jgi:hypothetical protein
MHTVRERGILQLGLQLHFSVVTTICNLSCFYILSWTELNELYQLAANKHSVPLEQQCWWSKCKSGSLICCQVSMWSFGKVQRAWGMDWKGSESMRYGLERYSEHEVYAQWWEGRACFRSICVFLNHHHSAPIFLVFMGSNPWGWWRTPQPRSYSWHFLHKFWLWMICGNCNSLEVSAIYSDCSWEHQAL